MTEKSSSGSGASPLGSTRKIIIGVGVLGALGAAAAFVLLGSKKQTRNLTPDVEIIDKL